VKTSDRNKSTLDVLISSTRSQIPHFSLSIITILKFFFSIKEKLNERFHKRYNDGIAPTIAPWFVTIDTADAMPEYSDYYTTGAWSNAPGDGHRA